MGCIQDSSSSRKAVSVPMQKGEFARRKSQFEAPPKSMNSSSSLRRQSSANVSDTGSGGGGVSLVLSGGSGHMGAAQPSPKKKPLNKYHSAGAAEVPLPSPGRRQSEAALPNPRRKSEAATTSRKFSVAAVKCKQCEEGIVGKAEEVKDSKGNVFHKTCLKCITCGISLANRECVINSKLKMSNQQYIAIGDDLYCDRHNPVAEEARRKNSVKGQNINERAVDSSELAQIGSSRRDLNEKAKEVLEDSGAIVSTEMTCGRCGHGIEKTQKMLVSGMQRFHEVCPTKAELEASDKPIQFFLKKLPDRLACVLTYDAKSKKPNTFLYILDKESLKKAVKAAGSSSATVDVVFFPDPQQHNSLNKRFEIPSQREFDLQVKAYPIASASSSTSNNNNNNSTTTAPATAGQFQFELVKNPSMKFSPQLQGTQLRITKQVLTNGIVQTVDAWFTYDESKSDSSACIPEYLVIRMESLETCHSSGNVILNESAIVSNAKRRREYAGATGDGTGAVRSSSSSASSSLPRAASSILKKRESSAAAAAVGEEDSSSRSGPSSSSCRKSNLSSSNPPATPTSPIFINSVGMLDSTNKPMPPPSPTKPTNLLASNKPSSQESQKNGGAAVLPPPLPKNKPNVSPIDMNVC